MQYAKCNCSEVITASEQIFKVSFVTEGVKYILTPIIKIDSSLASVRRFKAVDLDKIR